MSTTSIYDDRLMPAAAHNNRRPTARLLPALLLACLTLAGCGVNAPTPEQTAPRTLIFAVDGLDWDLLLPAMRAGRAPHMLDLARRGTAARLATFEPTDSPVIWTSVATGKVKEKHGISHFAERVGDRLVPVTSNQRLSRAFWNILGDAGHSVGLIGWWVTWPAEPINGWLVAPVSSIAGRTWKGSLYEELPDQTWPADLLTALQPHVAAVEAAASQDLPDLLPPPAADAPDWVNEFRRDLGWSITTDRIFIAATEAILKEHQPDVVAVYQGAVDVGGHRFWGYTHPADDSVPPHDVNEATARRLATYLPNVLEEVDAALGRLMNLLPPETDVILISDHGMHERRAKGPGEPWRNPLLRYNTGAHGDAPDGVWLAAGPSFEAAAGPFTLSGQADDLPRLGTQARPGILDVLPTLLHMRGLPVGDDMDGQVISALLAPSLKQRTVKHIPTYEPGPPPAQRPRPISTEADDDVVERLRSLGYLGGQ